MDTPIRDSASSDNLSALAWVYEELRKTLDTAHKALRRFVKESEAKAGADVDVVDPAVLRTARSSVHQGVGALELVGLPEAAVVLRSTEAALQKIIGKPSQLNAAVVDAIERTSFALLEYLSRRLAAKPVSALSLFTQYESMQKLAGADRVHPADLWPCDWSWRRVAVEASEAPRMADSRTNSEFERLMLNVIRGGDAQAYASAAELCAGLAAGTANLQAATLWSLAAGLFEAQSLDLVAPDVFTKRVASRLLSQLRMLQRGDSEVSERLALDLLFFCSLAVKPQGSLAAPRLRAVHQAYGIDWAAERVVAYNENHLGLFDPTLVAQARKRTLAAKEAWSAVAAGELHRLSSLHEQFSLLGDSLHRLIPGGGHLAVEFERVVSGIHASAQAPSAEMAMEVATALLYLDALLEEADFQSPIQAERVEQLAHRIRAVSDGQPAEPLARWMEELYRRVSDRQTMGSVVQELMVSLAEAEKSIDQFFRSPNKQEALREVPRHLMSMKGVLSVLGVDPAVQALNRMRDDVLALSGIDEAQPQVFERLASNLGALGFLIDLLNVQPQATKSLFVFDAASGLLSPLMGRAPGLDSEPVLSSPDSDWIPQEPGSAMAEVPQASVPSAPEQRVPVGEVSSSEPQVSNQAKADLEDDQEMRDIFLEEAREVIEAAVAGSSELRRQPGNLEQLTSLRRGFHTLKGSSRMVGLREFGEAAWACEQVFNAHLAEHAPATDALLDLSDWSMAYMQSWVDELSSGAGVSHEPQPVLERVEQYKRSLIADTEAGSQAPNLLSLAASPVLTPEPGPSSKEVSAPAESAAFSLDESLVSDALSAVDLGESRVPMEMEPQASMDASVIAEESVAAPELQEPSELPPLESSAETIEPALAEQPSDLSPPIELLPVEPETEPPEGVDHALGTTTETLPAPAWPVVSELAIDEPVESLDISELDLDLSLEPELSEDPIQASEQSLSVPEPEMLGGERLEFDLELPQGIEQAASVGDEAPLLADPASGEAIALSAEAGEPVAAEALVADGLEASLAPVPTPSSTELTLEQEQEQEQEQAQAPLEEAVAASIHPENDQTKAIGPLRIGVPLFNIYLSEADELSRRLLTSVGEWAVERRRPVDEHVIALAHSLAGSSATVGFADLSALARALEYALARSHEWGLADGKEAQLFVDAAEEIRRLLHQFAAGILQSPPDSLMARFAEHEQECVARQSPSAHAPEPSTEGDVSTEQVADEASLGAAVAAQSAEDQAPAVVDALPMPEQAPGAEEAALAAEATPAAVDNGSVNSSSEALAAFQALPELKSLAPLASVASLAAREASAAAELMGDGSDDDIDAVDAVDAELFPIFEEEAQELLPQLSSQLRDWADERMNASLASACMRTLHTLKGGARLAGAMRVGEMAHRMETHIESVLSKSEVSLHDIQALQFRADLLAQAFELLRNKDAANYEQAVSQVQVDAEPAALEGGSSSAPLVAAGPAGLAPEAADTSAREAERLPSRSEPSGMPAQAKVESATAVDWAKFTRIDTTVVRPALERVSQSQSSVRVRSPLLDRLVNQAGEVSITRARIEAEVAQIRSSMSDLSDNLDRLRGQLRDIDLQAETQMSSRMEAAKAADQAFDPLEFDRFTRFQELTRMMAESVNDVATVQRALLRTLESAEDALVAQARLTRDLQSDLLRTRMVEFEGLSDRLYRVVRQAAKETGKQVRLDIIGGSIEVDRGVLDRMTPAFEHLLRNSVTHGVEEASVRVAQGKDVVGNIVVAVAHDGNEVAIEFRDDGAGLDLMRIRDKGISMGLINPHDTVSDASLANLIFMPGFSTADKVTELAGRGVGMDVVRNEVNAMGGRVETATSPGQGTSFKLQLPLTTAVTQVVMMRMGNSTVAVPSSLIEIIRRAKPEEIEACYLGGAYQMGEGQLPFFWLGALLQHSPRSIETGHRTRHVVIVRSAQQRIAIHVDEVLGNQEVVVKNLGPQLARLPGLAGMTLLASGGVAMIYNPVALASVYGDQAQSVTRAALKGPIQEIRQVVEEAPQVVAPLVLVVDDSLTVRRVTQRLLAREGYRVVLAKDGLDALEKLAQERPKLVLSDIEMPRMDGFDLVRNIRGDSRLADLPVIMITSRIAQKHRDHAAELGVNHYLGKPYSEDDLLALVARYTGEPVHT